MKPLLITILEEAKRNKVMFRHKAYDHWNNNSDKEIDDWGYDIKRLIDMLDGYDGGSVEFLQAKYVDKDNKKIINMKRLRADLENYYYTDMTSKTPIHYSCDTELKHYGITIGEGDIENITSIDAGEAVEYLFANDGEFEWCTWDMTKDIPSAVTGACVTHKLAEVFDITVIEIKWLDDLRKLISLEGWDSLHR